MIFASESTRDSQNLHGLVQGKIQRQLAVLPIQVLEEDMLDRFLVGGVSGGDRSGIVEPFIYRSTPVCPNACMLAMFGAEGYASLIARRVEFDRKRIRAPLGDSPRFHTAGGSSALSRYGSRINSPLFSAIHGSPRISKRGSFGEIQLNTAAARTSEDVWIPNILHSIVGLITLP